MATFNPEANPGQFGLTSKEITLVTYGLERLILGPGPYFTDFDNRDYDADIATGKKRSIRYRAIMAQENPTDPYVIATNAINTETNRHFDEYGTSVVHPFWLANERAGAVIDAIPAGVIALNDIITRNTAPPILSYEYSKLVHPTFTNTLTEQLRPLVTQ